MTGPATGDWRKGVVFRWSGKLPTGSHAVTIIGASLEEPRGRKPGRPARSRSRPSRPQPRSRPPSRPKPTPKPTPKADPACDPRPTARPTARPARTPRPTAEPTPGSLAGPSLATDARTDPHAQGPPDRDRRPLPRSLAARSAASAASAVRAARVTRAARAPGSDGRSGPTGGPSQPSGRGWGPLAGLMAMAGLQGPTFTGLTVGPTLVTTTGAVALGMAFGLFGRRRREDESDDVLSAAAASGVGFMANAAVAVGDRGRHRGRLAAPCSMSTTPKC